MLLLSHVLLLYPRASLLEDPSSLATELRMMGLQNVLARTQPHNQLLCVEVLDSLLDSLAPDTADVYLSSLAALVTAPEREFRGSSLSLLACQYGASEEEARQWNANALFSLFKYSVP